MYIKLHKNLGKHNKLLIVWVPGQLEITSKEKVDKLAKIGRCTPLCNPSWELTLVVKTMQGLFYKNLFILKGSILAIHNGTNFSQVRVY